MSFVLLNDGKWRLYTVATDSNLTAIDTESEPRTPTFDIKSSKVAYIDADGNLREQHIKNRKASLLLTPGNKRAFTQPAYTPGGDKLYVVILKEGASVDTDIYELDRTRQQFRPAVTQRSAQFEPVYSPDNYLYYSNVACTTDCGRIIQEIWRKNTISGEAEQLTLLNTIARQPYLSANGKWLYFSSNKDGHFHIWRMHMESRAYEAVTNGQTTDINPVLDRDGTLYFIRRTPDNIKLMKLSKHTELTEIALPDGVQDIRDLKFSLR